MSTSRWPRRDRHRRWPRAGRRFRSPGSRVRLRRDSSPLRRVRRQRRRTTSSDHSRPGARTKSRTSMQRDLRSIAPCGCSGLTRHQRAFGPENRDERRDRFHAVGEHDGDAATRDRSPPQSVRHRSARRADRISPHDDPGSVALDHPGVVGGVHSRPSASWMLVIATFWCAHPAHAAIQSNVVRHGLLGQLTEADVKWTSG